MAISLGNDVSSYQGDINFEVYKNNTNFLIIKATEGIGFTDPKLSRNQSEARRVGIPLGYYHFARPDLNNSPEAEAERFLTRVGLLREGEVLVLDYEPPNQKQSDVDWCKKWLDRVQQLTGVKCLIYLNQSQVQKFDWRIVVDAGYGLWIAAYTYDPLDNTFNKGQWPFAAMQQWSNRQIVPGINGGVDANVFFGDIATFKKYGYKKPSSPSVSPSVSPSSSKSASPSPSHSVSSSPSSSPSPSAAPIDWKKKYDEEAQAHEETKTRLRNAKNYVASV